MQGTLIVIKTDGTTSEKKLDRTPTLAELSQEVGGYIEVVPCFDTWNGLPCVVFCNEEGKLQRLPVNHFAQMEWEKSLGSLVNDQLVGNVVICHGDDEFMQSL